jgi:hypothetical protein
MVWNDIKEDCISLVKNKNGISEVITIMDSNLNNAFVTKKDKLLYKCNAIIIKYIHGKSNIYWDSINTTPIQNIDIMIENNEIYNRYYVENMM